MPNYIFVHSSNIKAIGYAPDARVLQADFLIEPKSLFFCPPTSDRDLIVPTIGRFLNREIKKVYQYCQID